MRNLSKWSSTLLLIVMMSCAHHHNPSSTSSPPSPPESKVDTSQLLNSIEAPTETWTSAWPDPRPLAFQWPLKETVITSPYGWRKFRRKQKMHAGIDLRAKRGTSVYAAESGRVIYSARRIHGFGKMILIDHGNSWVTVYAHLSKALVKLGQRVQTGDLIGLSGATGRVKGPHLHFEIRKGSDPLDPVVYVPSQSNMYSKDP